MDKLQSSQLFQYIQSFLKTNEYIRLMNTSHEMFDEIKRETIIYELISTHKRPLDLGTLSKVVGRVKDGKKQVVLIMRSVEPADLSILAVVSQHLWKVRISTDHIQFPGDFDFSIFNNIPIVHLEGFLGVTRITNGLQNIQELKLCLYELASISNLTNHRSLRKLAIRWNAVKEFPEQLPKTFLSDLCANRRLDDSILGFSSFGSDPINMHHLFTRHLDCLTLDVSKMKLTLDQVSLLRDVKELRLINEYPTDPNDEDNYTELPIFTSFNGNRLNLTGFNLLIWENSCDMPNLTSLTLKECRSPATFPVLPKIVYLDLTEIVSLKTIPTLPTLRKLDLHSISNIILEKQPKLKYFIVMKCDEIVYQDTVPLPSLRTCYIYESDDMDVGPFLNAKYFQLRDSDSLMYSNIVREESYLRTGKEWYIKGQEKLEDIKKLHDLDKLELEGLKKTDFDQLEIKNINELSIFDCQDLKNTKNISNITNKLLINQCRNLVSLDSIQHISEVALGSLPKLTNISGLGHHDALYIFRVPYLAKLARWYSQDLEEENAEDNPFHEIFSTIKVCYIAKSILDEDEIYYGKDGTDSFNWFGLFDTFYFEKLWDFNE